MATCLELSAFLFSASGDAAAGLLAHPSPLPPELAVLSSHLAALSHTLAQAPWYCLCVLSLLH